MAFCNMCGAQIADGTTTCSVCAGRVATAPASTTAHRRGNDGQRGRHAGLHHHHPSHHFPGDGTLQQESFYPLPLVAVPFLCRAWLRCLVPVVILSIFAFMPFWLGHFAASSLAGLCVGVFVAWIILLIKANQGQMYKLPVIGDLAEKQANAI